MVALSLRQLTCCLCVPSSNRRTMAAAQPKLQLMPGTLRYRIEFGLAVVFGITYFVLRVIMSIGRPLEMAFTCLCESPLVMWIIL